MNKIQLIITCLIFVSCKDKNNIYSVEKWEENSVNYSGLFFLKNNKLSFFDGQTTSENLLTGKFVMKNDKVYFYSTSIKKLNFLLYDFTMKINECKKINYLKNGLYKHYDLCLLDKFYSNKIKNNIYKFYFKNYDLVIKSTGIVFFITKKDGIIGSYLIDETKNKVKINSKLIGETFEDRYNYDLYERFSLE